MNKVFFISILIISFFSLSTSTATNSFTLSSSKLNQLEQKYGSQARARAELWDSMMQSSKNEKILNKLKNVNDFLIKSHIKQILDTGKRKITGQHLLSF